MNPNQPAPSLPSLGFGDSWSFQNGQWLPLHQLVWSVTDLATTQGALLVERLRTYHGKVFRWSEHQARLCAGARALGLDWDRLLENWKSLSVADSEGSLKPLINQMLDRNRLFLASCRDASLVVLLSAGDPGNDSTRMAMPSLVIHLAPIPWERLHGWYTTGASLMVSTHWNVPSECWPTSIKSRCRLQYYMADRQIAARSPGALAVLPNRRGMLTETSVANLLFLLEPDLLVSPKLRDILPGVTLGAVVQEVAQLGMSVQYRDIDLDLALRSREIWMTGSVGCLWAATRLENQAIGTGKPGERMRQVQRFLVERLGCDFVAQTISPESPEVFSPNPFPSR